jgi:hypothetical protein
LISIDSYPRGLEVRKNNKLIGVTPLFDKDRVSNKLAYKIGDDELNYPIERCGMRWNDPLIDKIPFFKGLLPEGLSNIVSDYTPLSIVKGGKYECAALVRKVVDKSLIDEDSKKSCRQFLIISPPASSQIESEKISQRWISQNFKENKRNCDKVISPKAASSFLEFHGLHYLNKSYGIKYIMYGLMARMGHKLKATHLVFLQGTDNSLVPEVFDIHTRLKNAPELEKPIEVAQGVLQKESFLEKLSEAFKLIPNTVSLRYKFKRYLHLEPKESEALYSTRVSKLKLPPSLILSNMDYPLKTWGTNFRFSPSVTYKHWDQQYDIKYTHLIMALKLFGHTPIGTFIGRLGGGYGYIDALRIGGGWQQKEGVWVAQWGGSYYKFLGERYFLELGFRRNQIRTKKIVDGNFHLKGISELYFSFGLYLPELNTKAKSFFYN